MRLIGNDLRRQINDFGLHSQPKELRVSRDVVEAVEQAFQNWPMTDAETGEHYVTNICVVDPARGDAHVIFKGVALYYSPEETR